MMSKEFYIYILSNKNRSVFYAGVTNDLQRRLYEHKHKLTPGFTSRYCVSDLLYFEITIDPATAVTREKQIKDMRRERKVDLILKDNPGMIDLYEKLFEQ